MSLTAKRHKREMIGYGATGRGPSPQSALQENNAHALRQAHSSRIPSIQQPAGMATAAWGERHGPPSCASNPTGERR